MRKILLVLAGLLFVIPAFAQGIGGGTQVYQNWYPTGNSPSVTIGNTSTAHLFPSVGPTARICNPGGVDMFVNPYGIDNTITATISSFWVPASSCVSYNIKPGTVQYTYWAGITASGSTTAYVETGQGSP